MKIIKRYINKFLVSLTKKDGMGVFKSVIHNVNGMINEIFFKKQYAILFHFFLTGVSSVLMFFTSESLGLSSLSPQTIYTLAVIIFLFSLVTWIFYTCVTYRKHKAHGLIALSHFCCLNMLLLMFPVMFVPFEQFLKIISNYWSFYLFTFIIALVGVVINKTIDYYELKMSESYVAKKVNYWETIVRVISLLVVSTGVAMSIVALIITVFSIGFEFDFVYTPWVNFVIFSLSDWIIVTYYNWFFDAFKKLIAYCFLKISFIVDIMYNSQKHPFHLVTPSPWPFVASLSAFLMTYGMVSYMHSFKNGGLIIIFGVILFLFTLFVWWRDVVREATYEGVHTVAVQRGLRLGMLLFIVSEVMFFFAFFWAYFHSSLAPVIEIGSVWPSFGIVPFNPWGIPLLNTYILLLSGVTITYTHHYLTIGDFDKVVEGFIYTIALALVFTCFQAFEYFEAPFSISDSVYGSTFYMATGFHGFHVIIGTCFIIVCFIRLLNSHFTTQHHFGFEAAAWYWHFVDVVWLFLFISIYWWGSL